MKQPAADNALNAIANDCVAMRLRLLNRVLTNLYDDALRPLGLKASQLNILVAAYKFGSASPLKVCQFLHLDPSTLSRNVERMRANGWLQTMPGPDARAQPFGLTAAGRTLLHKAVPHWNTAQQQAKKLLGGEMIALLESTTRRLAQSHRKP